MKKLLLSIASALTLTLSAQPVLNVTLDSPTNGSSITAGTAFNFNVTVTNSGNQNHLGMPSDTVIYFPLFNGNLLATSGGGVVAWYMSDAISASGGTATASKSLNVSGGSSGTLEICAGIIYGGDSYTTTAQLDTSNNCANVNYSAMAIGELRLTETFDNSFYSNEVYYVQVSSRVDLVNPTIEIVDISGRTVKHINLTADGGEISQEISVSDLPQGVYIVRLNTTKGLISINKIIKQ